jgi:hypothetical protein
VWTLDEDIAKMKEDAADEHKALSNSAFSKRPDRRTTPTTTATATASAVDASYEKALQQEQQQQLQQQPPSQSAPRSAVARLSLSSSAGSALLDGQPSHSQSQSLADVSQEVKVTVAKLKNHLDQRLDEIAAAREREWQQLQQEMRMQQSSSSGCFGWRSKSRGSSSVSGGGANSRGSASSSRTLQQRDNRLLEMGAVANVAGVYKDRVSDAAMETNPMQARSSFSGRS